MFCVRKRCQPLGFTYIGIYQQHYTCCIYRDLMLLGNTTDPVLSNPILSNPVLSRPILSYPVLSYPIPSYPVLSRPILSYPVLSCPILSRPILSYPVLSYPILSYPVLPYPSTSHGRRHAAIHEEAYSNKYYIYIYICIPGRIFYIREEAR